MADPNTPTYAPTSSGDRDRGRANESSHGGGGSSSGGYDPNVTQKPDPTVLTTAALIREIASLKEIVFTRLDGMDRAILLFNENITRVPTDTDKQIGHLYTLTLEKFTTVDAKFDAYTERFKAIFDKFIEIEVKRVENKVDSSTGIAAALQAQKELVAQQNTSNALAITKSETGMLEQLKQLQALLAAEAKALDGKIADNKDRITTFEQRIVGQTTANMATQGSQTQWVGIIGLILGTLIALAGTALGIAGFMSEDSPAPTIVERVIVSPSTNDQAAPSTLRVP